MLSHCSNVHGSAMLAAKLMLISGTACMQMGAEDAFTLKGIGGCAASPLLPSLSGPHAHHSGPDGASADLIMLDRAGQLHQQHASSREDLPGRKGKRQRIADAAATSTLMNEARERSPEFLAPAGARRPRIKARNLDDADGE